MVDNDIFNNNLITEMAILAYDAYLPILESCAVIGQHIRLKNVHYNSNNNSYIHF